MTFFARAEQRRRELGISQCEAGELLYGRGTRYADKRWRVVIDNENHTIELIRRVAAVLQCEPADLI